MARKPVGAKGRNASPSASKVKKTISLDVETASRLGAFAGHHLTTESAVVTAALKAHLKGYQSFRKIEPGGESPIGSG